MVYWGFHLLLDCKGCNKFLITDRDNIKNFVDDLVKQIDMIAYGDTHIEHFATHDPDKAGYSFFQMIETSNISGHLVDKNGDAYIDVFSCKSFDIDLVQTIVDKWFSPEKIRVNYLTRNAD